MNYHMIICQILWSLQNEKTLWYAKHIKNPVGPRYTTRYTRNWSNWPHPNNLDGSCSGAVTIKTRVTVGVQCLWRKQGEAAKKKRCEWKGIFSFWKKQIRCSSSSSKPPPTKFRTIGFGKMEDAALHWPFPVQSFMSITEMKSLEKLMVFRTPLLPVPWRSRWGIHEDEGSWRANFRGFPKINVQKMGSATSCNAFSKNVYVRITG